MLASHVEVPAAFSEALAEKSLSEAFHNLPYLKRKEYARQVSEAKAEETRNRRVEKVLDQLGK